MTKHSKDTITCTLCGEEKPRSEFHKNSYRCKPCKKVHRDWYLYKYGISRETVEAMKVAQEHKCACCGKLTERLVVDHCHQTNDIRGLLCDKCNTGIGLLGDNQEGVLNALHYLST